jgi:hypothetical protein
MDAEEAVVLNKFLDSVGKYITKGDRRVLTKLFFGEAMNETDQRQLSRTKDLLYHPAAKGKIKTLLPDNHEYPVDWRDQASCRDRDDLYLNRLGSNKNEKIPEIQRICGSCAVRAQCKQEFENRRPEKGAWIDGIGMSAINTAKKLRRQKQSS